MLVQRVRVGSSELVYVSVLGMSSHLKVGVSHIYLREEACFCGGYRLA